MMTLLLRACNASARPRPMRHRKRCLFRSDAGKRLGAESRHILFDREATLAKGARPPEVTIKGLSEPTSAEPRASNGPLTKLMKAFRLNICLTKAFWYVVSTLTPSITRLRAFQR